MKDILLDENLEIVIGGRNDLELVEGRRQFEQSLSLWLQSFFYEQVGTLDTATAVSRVRNEAADIARMNGRIDEIQSIVVVPGEDVPNTLEVSIIYLTGETFERTLS